MSGLLDEENNYLPLKSKFRNNPLLKKPYVGKGKKSIYSLPKSNQHRYGKPNPPKDVPASVVINGWKYHNPSQFKEGSKQKKNFVKINRMALTNGYITAKEVNDFRKNNGEIIKNQSLKRKIPLSPTKNWQQEKLKLINKSLTYGQPSNLNNDDTDMNLVMQMQYYSNWINEQELLFKQQFKKHIANKKRGLSTIKPTKASIGHSTYYKSQQKKVNNQKDKQLQIQRYKNKFNYIKPRVQTPRPNYNRKNKKNTNNNRPSSARRFLDQYTA